MKSGRFHEIGGFHVKSSRFHVKSTQNLIKSDVSTKIPQFGGVQGGGYARISCEIRRKSKDHLQGIVTLCFDAFRDFVAF